MVKINIAVGPPTGLRGRRHGCGGPGPGLGHRGTMTRWHSCQLPSAQRGSQPEEPSAPPAWHGAWIWEGWSWPCVPWLSLCPQLLHTEISSDIWHKHHATRGKKRPYHVKQGCEWGRPAASTETPPHAPSPRWGSQAPGLEAGRCGFSWPPRVDKQGKGWGGASGHPTVDPSTPRPWQRTALRSLTAHLTGRAANPARQCPGPQAGGQPDPRGGRDFEQNAIRENSEAIR